MNPHSLLLQNALVEMRQFQQTSPEVGHFEKSLLERLAARREHASSLGDAPAAELEILAIARSDIDSGTSNQTAMPSFYMVLDAVQRIASAGRSERPQWVIYGLSRSLLASGPGNLVSLANRPVRPEAAT
jgi:hypothetical protein